MIYGSVCSGIEAATIAWEPLGWKPAFFSEIDLFPRALLSYHYPAVPLHGDFTTIGVNEYAPIDLLVGGTPCQSFSIAGLRAGMDDDRGNLSLEFVRLAKRLRPRWVVWENVPGVLSSNGGRDFGSILGALGELGYGFAYRVLNAQYFGVPQRRRRVFLVGYFGDWRPAAAVLFEQESLRGDSSPFKKEGTIASALTRSGLGGGGPDDNLAQGNHLVAPTLQSHAAKQWIDSPIVAGTLRASGSGVERVGNGEDKMLVAFSCKDHGADASPVSPTLRAMHHTKSTPNGGGQVAIASQNFSVDNRVRRLTPKECERLQGFPDDYTNIPFLRGRPATDGHRYRALGNSMAVPCMAWLGRRIAFVDEVVREG